MKKIAFLVISFIFAYENLSFAGQLGEDIRLGPILNLVSVPHPLSLGIEGFYKNKISFSLEKEFFPQIIVQDINAKIDSIEINARVHPLNGSFFIGLGYGNQTLMANKTEEISFFSAGDFTLKSPPVSANAEINTSFLTPHLGWRWVWDSGFMMGLDLGWQFALSAKTTFDIKVSGINGSDEATLKSTSAYNNLITMVEDVGNKIGKTGLPSVSLLHIGWMF